MWLYALGIYLGGHTMLFSRDVRICNTSTGMLLSVEGLGTRNCKEFRLQPNMFSTTIVMDNFSFTSYRPVVVRRIVA